MHRFLRMTKVALALSLMGSLTVASCRDLADPEGPSGRINLALALPGGVSVSAAAWKVLSSSGAVLASGTINTTNANSTPSVSVGLPAGSGDTVNMTATTSAGASCSGTSAPFNVVAGQAVAVPVTVNCGATSADGGLGSVVVSGMLVAGDSCPALASWTISPQQTAANGGTIDVAATATDADSGETLTYAWSATAGSFANPALSSTQYTCAGAGSQTLTVTVSDNHAPTPCSINVSFPPIDCL